jgi:hypothetical protein
MVWEIVVQLGIGPHVVQELIVMFGYQKVCSHWVPHLLTDENKESHLDVSSQFLKHHAAKSDDFLFNILTGN